MMSSLKPFSQTAKQSTDFTEFEVINEVKNKLFRMTDLIDIWKLLKLVL